MADPVRPPIDPELRRFLQEQAAASPGPAASQAEARQRMEAALAARGPLPLPRDVRATDHTVEPHLPVRVYQPAKSPAEPLPVLVYLHGGGWVAGSLATHDPFCRMLCSLSGVLVAAVDYRLAPEHVYPAALEDTHTALDWVRQHAATWGGDPQRLALGGDSAGGNLAAVVANERPSDLRALLLLYPATDHPDARHPSYTENAVGFGLEAAGMRWFWQQYAPLGNPADPRLFPLRASLPSSLPPTLVATAGYDVLCDEGLQYAQRLRQAGIVVHALHTGEMHHNFPVGPATVMRFPQCAAVLEEVAAWLRSTLA